MGGRKQIPFGDVYGPIIKIRGISIEDFGNWSLLVKNETQLSEFETIAQIHYLSKEAPDNLKKNVEFELYEGSKLIASGKIL